MSAEALTTMTERHVHKLRLIAESAAAAFKEAGWKWNRPDKGHAHVPDADEIEAELHRLLENVKPNWGDGYTTSCGRLHLHVNEDDIDVSLDIGTVDGLMSALRQEDQRG